MHLYPIEYIMIYKITDINNYTYSYMQCVHHTILYTCITQLTVTFVYTMR